jgi:hypothetical protein
MGVSNPLAKLPAPGRNPLAKLLPAVSSCPHVLGRWLLRTSKSSATYPDGVERPIELRGGRLVRVGDACVYAPDHVGAHRTGGGRDWA